MDLAETSERKLVRRTMQSFIDYRWPLPAVRELVDGRATVPKDLHAGGCHPGVVRALRRRGAGWRLLHRRPHERRGPGRRAAGCQPAAWCLRIGLRGGRPAAGQWLAGGSSAARAVGRGEGLVALACSGDSGSGSGELAGPAAIAWPEGEGGAAAKVFLESKKPAIAGGTEQMQRNAISERVLGLPREPGYHVGRPFSQVLKSAGSWTSERRP